MKAVLVLFVVIFLLIAWTAVRYRKQIMAIIGVLRMVREAADPEKGRREIREKTVATPHELIRCARCGVWVPNDRAIRFSSTTFYCSEACVKSTITTG